MSEKKYADDDPERTLITLDQLSQTIEVMTSVVNRLRRHLSAQITAQLDELESENYLASQQAGSLNPPPDPGTGDAAEDGTTIAVVQQQAQQEDEKKERFVVEINQQEVEPVRKTSKILH